VRATLPEAPWVRAERYRALSLDDGAAQRLAAAPWAPLFDEAKPPAGALARRLAASLAKRMPYHARRGRPVPRATGHVLRGALERIAAAIIRPEALDRIVDAALAAPDGDVDRVLAPFVGNGFDEALLERVVVDVVERSRALAGREPAALLRWAMGETMPGLLGRADPAGAVGETR
jgi:Glu-tRNA(Gln) amidotransferase subunit E-like FAD-binding protein